MGLVLQFRQIANWCTVSFPPQNNWSVSFSVHSWAPSACESAQHSAGIPPSRLWPRVFLELWASGREPRPWQVCHPSKCLHVLLVQNSSRAGRERLCSGLSSFLFALPLGIYCPFDRNCEEDFHHLETPPRQGLVLFFLTFLGASKSTGSVHITWWYPVGHWTLDFPCSFFRKFLLKSYWNSSPAWPSEISCQQLICTISVFFLFPFFGLFVWYADLSTPTVDRIFAPCFGSSES